MPVPPSSQPVPQTPSTKSRAFAGINAEEIDEKLAAYRAAWAGEKGALLLAASTVDGEQQAEYPLQAPPVFDGLIAANGRLYLGLTDGNVVCMGRKELRLLDTPRTERARRAVRRGG